MRLERVVWVALLWVLISPLVVGEEFSPTKTVIMSMEFREGVLYHNDTVIVYNYRPAYEMNPSNGLNIKVYTAGENEAEEFQYYDPRRIRSPADGFHYLENVSFDIIIPFIKEVQIIKVFDSNGTELIAVDISDSLREFCMEVNHYCDPDCVEGVDPDCELGTTTVRATTLPTAISTTVSTTTLEPEEKQDIIGYLPYLVGAIILIVIIFVVLRSNRISKKERKKKDEEEKLRNWVEEQLREGEDPALLKKALEKQGSSPKVVDEFMQKL